jgi:hypothetical protein
MKKKVGLVTCYFKNNYGSYLQALATQHFLDKNMIDNDTICIDNLTDFARGKRKYYLTQLANIHFYSAKKGMIKMKIIAKIKKNLKKNLTAREKAFESSKSLFRLTKPFVTYAELSSYAERKYNSVVVGSDQLWLPVNVVSDYYTLNWAGDDINKVSYATSFGVSKIPKGLKGKYASFLKRINHVSVREDTAVKLVAEEAGVKAKLVCDPTLLLTQKEWGDICKNHAAPEGDYIFCYFLGNNKNHRDFAKRLKDITGCKIISINHCDEYDKYSDTFADIAPYDVDPLQFVNYIKNAKYVCTDSFHGTVFSLINEKDFFVFERFKKKQSMSTNSRIYSLLKIVGCENRLVTEYAGDIDLSGMEYGPIKKRLEAFREESSDWLLEALK